MVALVLAFISLFNIPFGTALGVYTLWALLPSQSQQEYEALVTARESGKAFAPLSARLKHDGERARAVAMDGIEAAKKATGVF